MGGRAHFQERGEDQMSGGRAVDIGHGQVQTSSTLPRKCYCLSTSGASCKRKMQGRTMAVSGKLSFA